jgi:hypothetical protein
MTETERTFRENFCKLIQSMPEEAIPIACEELISDQSWMGTTDDFDLCLMRDGLQDLLDAIREELTCREDTRDSAPTDKAPSDKRTFIARGCRSNGICISSRRRCRSAVNRARLTDFHERGIRNERQRGNRRAVVLS